MFERPFHSESLSDKTFLITGGAGFIGSNITAYLLKYGARKVRVLDNLLTGRIENIHPFLSHPNFEFIEGDIRDLEVCRKACEKILHVSHQAALGSVPRSINDPVTTHEINSTGFINMLAAGRYEKVKNIVYASSSSVYGNHPALPKKESDTGQPLSPYAATKKTNELYAGVFTEVYNMKLIGLRYFNVFGPGQSPEGPYAAVIPLFIRSLLKNESPYIDGDGNQTRDFTFVENAVEANIKAMLCSNPDGWNQVYNVAAGERVSINELFRMVALLVNSTLKPIYRDSRPGDVRDSLADLSLANKLLGYSPAVYLKEGLQQTIDWFKSKS